MASDQSETSGGSRVRQFGLYRSIDSRTEEFLRLSRRRQMRQGCACAIISTAITVTIVVGALLLFEYNVASNEDIKSNVPNWHNLLNDTAEAMSLNTLKMLPILLKELNKNKVESTFETTTKRQIQEKRHTTEFLYKKNVFSDRKNWVRLPTSRIYAIEYKTPTIAYFKTPKNDYFTKIRKIRDYKRIINYVDKMISDRVAFGSTQPMQTINDYTAEDLQTQRIPSKKLSRTSNLPKESLVRDVTTSTRKPKTKGESSKNCNCPNKIGDILNDLVSNIKLLVPYSTTTESQGNHIQGKKILHPLDNNDFTPSANAHALTGQVVKGLLNQNLKQVHYEYPTERTGKPFKESLSSLGYDNKDGKTVFGILQQKITGQKTYIFQGYVHNVTETPGIFIEKTDSYIPLHFIAPSSREDNKRNLNQKLRLNRILSTSTSKEQYTHLRDPLRFNANAQEDEEEENIKNEDYKMPEHVSSTLRLHFANNYPLHFIANTRDYDEGGIKNDFKKMTSKEYLSTSTPTSKILYITPNYRKDKLKNSNKKNSLKGIITTSTLKIYYAKNEQLHLAPNAMDYEEEKRNNDKGMPVDETNDDSAEDDFISRKNTAAGQIYLKPSSSLNNMNKTYEATQHYANPKTNILSANLNSSNKTMWHTQSLKPGNKIKFYPMITTHFLYHRHNITTSPPPKLDLTTTTVKTPVSSIKTTIPVANNYVEETTITHFVETFNFTSNLLKTKIRGNDSPTNNQKFKDDTGFRFEELNLDDDFDKIINEDNYQEINEKDDFISTVFNNFETQTKKNVVTTSKVDKQSTTDFRDKEDIFFTSSVFHNKPRSYLEIQRNYLNDIENN